MIKTEYSDNFSTNTIYFGDFIHHIDIYNNTIADNLFEGFDFFDISYTEHKFSEYDILNIPNVTYRNKNEIIYTIDEFLKNKEKTYVCAYKIHVIYFYIKCITENLATLKSIYE
jgi:hypothetical protein